LFPETHFTDPASVEAWDCWFRWRERGVLRDLTVDATWSRVGHSVASVEGSSAGKWARRFIDAFRHWRLLPDSHLLRFAGTGTPLGQAPLTAVVNAAVFVSSPGTADAAFDRPGFAETASLTVRLLDDVLLACDESMRGSGLRIGLIGMADAMHHLGLPYDSAGARQFAGHVAGALSEGALKGATELAWERGAAEHDRHQLARRWHERGTPAGLVDEVLRCGMRHTQLTAIEAQPRLSLLANNASDALDPCPFERPVQAASRGGVLADVSMLAQLELRAAIQPWIDAPIDYPVLSTSEPDADELEALLQLARDRGLQPVTLRRIRSRILIDDDGQEH
jgi:ribonucleoside-diphosphate reductase alpha chain